MTKRNPGEPVRLNLKTSSRKIPTYDDLSVSDQELVRRAEQRSITTGDENGTPSPLASMKTDAERHAAILETITLEELRRNAGAPTASSGLQSSKTGAAVARERRRQSSKSTETERF